MTDSRLPAAPIPSPAVIPSSSAPGALLRIDSVSKSFGGVAAVAGVSLDIAEREFFALLGPSGCGKTTLLRMLAGFERPDTGRILLDGEDIAAVPPHRRPVNMMFQSYALFPHLTVAANVAFGLKQERLPGAEIAARVDEMLALVRMQTYTARKPDQLSGGQRQRVALARALAKRPRLLLLDEPLSALDRKLREETRLELAELQKRLGLTFIVVTHDQDEALSMATRIGVMNQGALVQVGTPQDLYERPASRWVAGFIGDANLIDGTVRIGADGGATLQCAEGIRFDLPAGTTAETGSTVTLMVRPEKIVLTPSGPDADGATGASTGRVEDVSYLGGFSLCRVRLASGGMIRAAVANRGGDGLRPGASVAVQIAPNAAVVLPS